MIPGVAAQGTRGGVASTGPIATDSAVQFNSAYLVGNLSCTDNEFFGFSGFFKSDWSTLEVAFIVQDFMTSLSGFGAPPPHNVEFSANSFNDVQHVSLIESGTADTTWHHIIGAAKTNLAAGTKIIKLFIDGVDVSGVKADADASFTFSSDGAQLWVGWNGDPFSVGIPKYNGSMCNLWVGPGINLLTGSTISSTTIQLFRKTNGCPEDPAVAIAALGAPPVFLCGNAAQFASNTYGTGGSFSIISGTLTDDANGPCTGIGAGVGSAAGTGSAAAITNTFTTRSAVAAGTGAAAAVGFTILGAGSAIGSAPGTGAAAAVGRTIVARSAVAAGTGVATAIGSATAAATATASGTGAASGHVPAPWTPSQISTLLWFDASSSANFSLSGTAIGQWNDLSGNANHVSQSSAAAKPIYNTTTRTINSLSVAEFGTDDVLENLGALSGFVALNTSTGVTDTFTFAMIARDRVAAANWGLFDISNNTNTNMILNPFINNATTLNVRAYGTGNEGTKAITQNTTDGILWSGVGGRANRTAFIHGTSGTPQTGSAGVLTVTPTNLRIGAFFNNVFFGPADIGELVLFQGVNTTNRQLVEGYLAWKWGTVSVLDAGHPYKSAAPTT